MSILEKNIIKQVRVKSNIKVQTPYTANVIAYRGISTVNPESTNPVLYDLALIKQDLINHFHIRQGEKLSDPNFGTIIWDVLFDPLTDDLRNAIIDDVTAIITLDPRLDVNNVIVDQYESGLQIECSLLYLPYNISEQMRLQFDENNGFLTN